MIERHWKGITRPDAAAAYITHLQTKTFPHLAELQGFLKATILRRPVEAGTEFLIITAWDSLDSIKQFAGENVETANVPPEARRLMVEFDATAKHYEVV
jgi:heme-degrading monooxygenase HmoA